MSIKGIYDIHCHIVPGVDDGATDIGETVKLLRMEYEQGVRTVIATPHFRFRMQPGKIIFMSRQKFPYSAKNMNLLRKESCLCRWDLKKWKKPFGNIV